MRIYTIGYEGTTVQELVNELNRLCVQTLIDVRLVPLSRKPGFSKHVLAYRLQSEGIDYLHEKRLGCPSMIRDQYKNDGDWGAYTKQFKRYLASQDAALEGLLPVAETSVCCLLCFERDPDFCHRKYVAERLAELSDGQLTVTHLYPQRAGLRKPVADSKTDPVLPGLVFP